MVPKKRVELLWCHHRRILNPLRLPIPPLRQSRERILHFFIRIARIEFKKMRLFLLNPDKMRHLDKMKMHLSFFFPENIVHFWGICFHMIFVNNILKTMNCVFKIKNYRR